MNKIEVYELQSHWDVACNNGKQENAGGLGWNCHLGSVV